MSVGLKGKNTGFVSVLTWSCGNLALIFLMKNWWQIFLWKFCVLQRLRAWKAKQNHGDRKPPISPKQLSTYLQKSKPVIDLNMSRNEQPGVQPILFCGIRFSSGLKLSISSCPWYDKVSVIRMPNLLSEVLFGFWFLLHVCDGKVWDLPSSFHVLQSSSLQPARGRGTD